MKRSWPDLSFSLGLCLEDLRKNKRNFSQDSRSPGLDLKPGPDDYASGFFYHLTTAFGGEFLH
jgi:hypothetical protein